MQFSPNTWNIVVNSLVTYLLQRKSGETYHKLYKILKKYICDYVNLGLLRQENADLWWIPITNARWSLLSSDECFLCMIIYFGPKFKKHILLYWWGTFCCSSHICTLVDKLRSANLLITSAHTYICYMKHITSK